MKNRAPGKTYRHEKNSMITTFCSTCMFVYKGRICLKKMCRDAQRKQITFILIMYQTNKIILNQHHAVKILILTPTPPQKKIGICIGTC